MIPAVNYVFFAEVGAFRVVAVHRVAAYHSYPDASMIGRLRADICRYVTRYKTYERRGRETVGCERESWL